MKVKIEKLENLLEEFAVSANAVTLHAIERVCFGNASIEAQFRDKRIPFALLKEIMLENSTGKLHIRIREALRVLEERCNAIVLVVKTKHLKKQADGKYRISSKSLKERRVHPEIPICPDIPYGEEQSMYSLGTGFFIAENIVATAAHVLLDVQNLKKDIRFIICSDFDSSTTEVLVSEDQIFTPNDTTLKNYDYTATNQDWALVEVQPKAHLKTRTLSLSSKKPLFKDPVYAIGHGLGLPKKISYGGYIIKNDRTKRFFECAISAFAGNSGSPVFDALTNEVIGIAIRANKKLSRCSTNNCVIIENVLSEFEGVECQLIKPVAECLQQVQNILPSDTDLQKAA